MTPPRAKRLRRSQGFWAFHFLCHSFWGDAFVICPHNARGAAEGARETRTVRKKKLDLALAGLAVCSDALCVALVCRKPRNKALGAALRLAECLIVPEASLARVAAAGADTADTEARRPDSSFPHIREPLNDLDPRRRGRRPLVPYERV